MDIEQIIPSSFITKDGPIIAEVCGTSVVMLDQNFQEFTRLDFDEKINDVALSNDELEVVAVALNKGIKYWYYTCESFYRSYSPI